MHEAELSEEVMALAERAARLYVERGSAPVALPGIPQEEALPAAEASILDKAGLDISDAVEKGEADPAAEAVEEYMEILASAMTVRATAGALGVDPSRVRQLIRGRSMAAIAEKRLYLIPRFQFAGARLIPSFESIYRATSPDVPLILFYRWFTQPSPDLPADEQDQDRNFSPREWLLAGFDPAPVERMAGLL